MTGNLNLFLGLFIKTFGFRHVKQGKRLWSVSRSDLFTFTAIELGTQEADQLKKDSGFPGIHFTQGYYFSLEIKDKSLKKIRRIR